MLDELVDYVSIRAEDAFSSPNNDTEDRPEIDTTPIPKQDIPEINTNEPLDISPTE